MSDYNPFNDKIVLCPTLPRVNGHIVCFIISRILGIHDVDNKVLLVNESSCMGFETADSTEDKERTGDFTWEARRDRYWSGTGTSQQRVHHEHTHSLTKGDVQMIKNSHLKVIPMIIRHPFLQLFSTLRLFLKQSSKVTLDQLVELIKDPVNKDTLQMGLDMTHTSWKNFKTISEELGEKVAFIDGQYTIEHPVEFSKKIAKKLGFFLNDEQIEEGVLSWKVGESFDFANIVVDTLGLPADNDWNGPSTSSTSVIKPSTKFDLNKLDQDYDTLTTALKTQFSKLGEQFQMMTDLYRSVSQSDKYIGYPGYPGN